MGMTQEIKVPEIEGIEMSPRMDRTRTVSAKSRNEALKD